VKSSRDLGKKVLDGICLEKQLFFYRSESSKKNYIDWNLQSFFVHILNSESLVSFICEAQSYLSLVSIHSSISLLILGVMAAILVEN
jgi:hypothetical protein